MGRKKKKGAQKKIPKRPLKTLVQSWYASKAPVFKFGLKFCALILLFYIILLIPVFEGTLSASSVVNARLASGILNVLGERTHVNDATIQSAKYAITVLPACSALEYVWFFCAAVIAFPARVAFKISGILAGVILLLGLNLLRIASLYYIGVHYPGFFDSAHEDLWGLVLIIAEIVLCAAWIGWVRHYDYLQLDQA